MATDTYDVIVIGGGPAGENAADYATRNSDRTALIIEHELVGGECSYWACIPSKALLRPAHVLELARHVPGVQVSDLDVKNVLAQRDSFTSHRDDAGQVRWANDQGIDVVRGTGRLTGPRTVTVDGATTLHARHAVVLATGTTANVPDVPGLRAARPWTSRDATNLEDVPGRLVIVGGGVVACEAATWLRAFGAEVTLLVRGRRLLTNTEPFAGERVAAALQERGVRVEFGADPQSVLRPEVADTGIGRIHGGPVTVTVSGEEIVADEILVAAGRAPATDLGLESIGLEPRYVEVDDHLTVPEFDWLYAVGDITHRAALTHMGKYQARVCGDVIAARAEGRDLTGSRFTASADHGAVPQVVFTDPEVAAVGRTEAQARKEGFDVSTVELDIDVSGSALARDDFRGRAALVVDDATDTLLGVTFVGPDVGELVHSATIAVVGRVTLDTLWHAVPSYPTVSEIWLRLLEARRQQPGRTRL